MSEETRQQLLDAGFDLTGAPRFERLPPIYDEKVHTLARVCQCDRTASIEQTVWVRIETKWRRFFAGQCSGCGVITWAHWLNRVGIYEGSRRVVPPIQTRV